MTNSLVEKKWVPIKTDWFQQASQSNARFCIEKQDVEDNPNPSWLFQVRVDKKPTLHPTPMLSQTYYEGLWEYDVAEWFIVNSATGKYIEWNLAPTGAWWMMLFDAPRQRAIDINAMPDLSSVITTSCHDEIAWSASLQFPVSLLAKLLGKDGDSMNLTHNVCFILGQKPREYLSWTMLKAKQPDFHRPAEFGVLAL